MAENQYIWGKVVKRLALCCTFLVSAQQASAGWRDTEWGMSEAEFRQAAPFVQDAISPNGTPILVYDEDGRQMWVNVKFEGGGLSSVNISPYDQKDCEWLDSRVRNAFRGYPSKPISTIDLGAVFFDAERGNEVSYWMGGICSATFRPLRGNGQP